MVEKCSMYIFSFPLEDSPYLIMTDWLTNTKKRRKKGYEKELIVGIEMVDLKNVWRVKEWKNTDSHIFI